MPTGLQGSLEGEFRGTDRFIVKRRLGAGAMGVVYQAFDRERGTEVALKTLRSVDAAGIYRFKQEFRALTDISHPNLISLNELVSAGDTWFFTMELVDGMNLLAYVREGADAASAETLTDVSGPNPVASAAASVARDARPLSAVDLGRLRHTMRQLAEGVYVLHQAGMLHRDIKPSNILVTREGRLVLLDFGLVAEMSSQRRPERGGPVVGTAAYMAPEQGAGMPLSEASDWYAVGVVLYQALTRRLPFVGEVIEV